MTPGTTLLAGRYRLGDVLGQGGMATVHRAHDEVLGRDVAVKVFPPAPAGDDDGRPAAEMRVLAALNHPGLVTLYDAGGTLAGDGRQQSYLVMELVDGPTLADVLVRGALPPTLVARLGAQLASALTVVHDADVVHRDVKPANVLLALGPGAGGDPDATADIALDDPTAKLADFGIARFADGTRLTVTGTTLGTASYLSPEQASGGPIGPPTDIYALGLVLLECLTGRKAFTGTILEVATARLTTPPAIPDDLDGRWRDLLVEMTHRDPGERPTAAAVASRLEGLALPDEPAPETVPLVPAAAASASAPIEATRALPLGPRPDDADTAPDSRGGRADVPADAPVDDAPVASLPATAVRPGGEARTTDGGSHATEGAPDPSGTRTGAHVPQHAAASVPVRGPAARARWWGRTHPAALAAAVVGCALVVAGAATGVATARDDVPAAEIAPTLPVVEGPLGDALDELARSVQP